MAKEKKLHRKGRQGREGKAKTKETRIKISRAMPKHAENPIF
jgi:hypothetical protein